MQPSAFIPDRTAVVCIAIACVFAATLANAQSGDLITAAQRGDLPVVRALLNSNADVNASNTAGSTALIEASSNGHVEVVQMLLAAKADVNATRDGEAALFLASANGHLEVVRALLAAKADVDAKCCDGIPTRYEAREEFRREVQNGSAVTVKRVMAVKPDDRPKVEVEGRTALIMALSNGHMDVARALVEAGANVNAMTSNGVTPLKLAAAGSSPESLAMVRTLLAAYADVNGGLLPDRRANLVVSPSQGFRGGTALTVASSTGSADIVRALLSTSAYVDVNAENEDGNTSLIIASASGRADVVLLLLTAKANVSAVEKNGNTALMLASAEGHLEVVEALLAAKVDVNATRNAHRGKPPQDQATALILAAQNGHLDVVQALLAAKADVNATERDGSTALTLALRYDHAEVANLLRSAIAAGK